MTRVLIKNGNLVTLGESNRVLTDHALAIDAGVIVGIKEQNSFDPACFDDVIDAAGMVVLPGFINGHMHFYSSFARGLTKAQPANNFLETLENLWWRLDKKLSLEDSHYSALVSCIDAIKSGTTTIIDHHASPNHVRGSLASLATAVRQAGLRASLCYEVSDRDGSQIAEEGLDENVQFIKDVAAGDGQITALFGLHAALTLSDKTLFQAGKLASDLGVGCHIHVAEDRCDQEHSLKQHRTRVVSRLFDAGILGRQTICAHCVHVNDVEVALLAQTESIVTHQAQSNMNNAVGTMDLLQLRNAGVLVGMGTDAMTQNMLEELRTALWMQKLHHHAPSGLFLEMVETLTLNNARICNRLFPLKLGELAEGCAADICIADYQPYTPMNSDNFAGHLVFGISQAKIDTTIASGRVLMRGGKLLSLDEQAIRANAVELASALWDRF